MKRLLLFALLLFSTSVFARGGDLGGGGRGTGRGTGGGGGQGQIRAGFVLTSAEVQLLRSQPNLESAYQVWIQENNDPVRKEEILQQVFKYHIIPQL